MLLDLQHKKIRQNYQSKLRKTFQILQTPKLNKNGYNCLRRSHLVIQKECLSLVKVMDQRQVVSREEERQVPVVNFPEGQAPLRKTIILATKDPNLWYQAWCPHLQDNQECNTTIHNSKWWWHKTNKFQVVIKWCTEVDIINNSKFINKHLLLWENNQ